MNSPWKQSSPSATVMQSRTCAVIKHNIRRMNTSVSVKCPSYHVPGHNHTHAAYTNSLTILTCHIMLTTHADSDQPRTAYRAVQQVTLPHLVTAALQELFSEFDACCDKHGVYKVETIGDAYMCVAGHEGQCDDHALRMLMMAQSMLQATERVGKRIGQDLQIRVGVHTGG